MIPHHLSLSALAKQGWFDPVPLQSTSSVIIETDMKFEGSQMNLRFFMCAKKKSQSPLFAHTVYRVLAHIREVFEYANYKDSSL